MMTRRLIEISDQLPLADAWVAAWLPGTEGNGVADVLFGDDEFTGKLPFTWQPWNSQLPFKFQSLPSQGCGAPLFAFGYGLTTKDKSPIIPDCPRPSDFNTLARRNQDAKNSVVLRGIVT